MLSAFCLAVDGGLNGGACFGQSGRLQFADLVDQVGLGDDSEIVEAGDAVSRHAVVGSQS